MFRAIVNGFNGLLRRRSSINASEISATLREPLTQSQLPTQVNPQSSIPAESTPPIQPAQSLMQRRSSTSINMAQFVLPPNRAMSTQSVAPKPPKAISPDNLVRVRIWTSKTEDGQDTYGANAVLEGGNVGHATLETSKIYASIWPSERPASSTDSVEPYYEKDPNKDIVSEGNRNPDYIIDFYSLDTKAIEQFFKKVEQEKEPWTLLGKMLNEKGYSCSCLTMALLEIGGINNLAGSVSRKVVSPTSNFAVSPNNLVNQLSLAKIVEERKYPEVMDYQSVQKESPKKESFLVAYKAEKVKITKSLENTQDVAINNTSTPTMKRS